MPYVKKGERLVRADDKQLERLIADGWERCEAPEVTEESYGPRGKLFEPKAPQHKLYRDGKTLLVDSKQLAVFQSQGWSLEAPSEEPEEEEDPVEDNLDDLGSLEPEDDEE